MNLKDETYLKIAHRLFIGRKLNLDNPRTFNEKLHWLKLNNRKPEYQMMVDKYAVREYISEKIGPEYLIPLIGVWENTDEIDFNALPNQFVLKCNHDSNSAVICKDKSTLDTKATIQKLNRCLHRNLFYWGREWPYKNIKPLVIAEQYMEDKSGDLEDYKFMCFNGEPRMVFTCTERRSKDGLKVTFFDLEWNKLPFYRHYPSSANEIPKPKNLDKMIEFARLFSKDIPFLRVDFYEINDKLYFGELTFFPGCGYEEFHPEEWDYKLGEMINLNE